MNIFSLFQELQKSITVMSLETHSNAWKVIKFVEENLDLEIVLERTGSLVAMQKYKFIFHLQKRE